MKRILLHSFLSMSLCGCSTLQDFKDLTNQRKITADKQAQTLEQEQFARQAEVERMDQERDHEARRIKIRKEQVLVEGADMKVVKAELGEPSHLEFKGNIKYLHYNNELPPLILGFKEGKLFSKEINVNLIQTKILAR